MKIGIFTALTVLFVALKLTGVIAWSWWLVLSPAIIATVLFTFLVLLWVALEMVK